MELEPTNDADSDAGSEPISPKRPTTLPELAEAILEALGREPLSANIILGGGVALKHYDDFRATQDIDAWWREFRDPDTMERVRAALGDLAVEKGLGIEHRHFGLTDSLEFTTRDNPSKVFSFQISVRDVPLDEPLLSAWPPLRLETFRDNIGSKMNALVNRGAPRDLVDIHRVVTDGLMMPLECWRLWRMKNAEGTVEDACTRVRVRLTRLEQRRPLASIASPLERQAAEALRRWYREVFLSAAEEMP